MGPEVRLTLALEADAEVVTPEADGGAFASDPGEDVMNSADVIVAGEAGQLGRTSDLFAE